MSDEEQRGWFALSGFIVIRKNLLKSVGKVLTSSSSEKVFVIAIKENGKSSHLKEFLLRLF